MRILERSLVFVVGLLAAWGFYHFNTTKNTNLSWPPSNTNTNQLSAVHVDHLQLQASGGSPEKFDHFLLALEWPKSFCKKKPFCWPNPPTQQHFIIHGLWPQLKNGQALEYCTSNDSMTDHVLVEFKDDLLEYWPNLYCAGNFSCKGFWYYEWRKHGSCSSEKFNPRQYLEITIDLAKKYGPSILSKMKAKDLDPDTATKASIKAIKKAVEDATGVSAAKYISFVNNSALLEIRLCVKKNGTSFFKCN